MIKRVTASEKKKLKERLRKLDKKLYRFYWFTRKDLFITNRQIFPDMHKELRKLDEKRKIIRNKLK